LVKVKAIQCLGNDDAKAIYCRDLDFARDLHQKVKVKAIHLLDISLAPGHEDEAFALVTLTSTLTYICESKVSIIALLQKTVAMARSLTVVTFTGPSPTLEGQGDPAPAESPPCRDVWCTSSSSMALPEQHRKSAPTCQK